jgi:hypothetical protein
MAYVFGIGGVPVFEMLFIFSLLLLIGLVFILLELKRLSNLIGKEKSDLQRFESDLQKFEGDTGKKSSDELVDYVKTAIDKGLTYSQVEASLIQRGWPKKEVDSVLNKLGKKRQQEIQAQEKQDNQDKQDSQAQPDKKEG